MKNHYERCSDDCLYQSPEHDKVLDVELAKTLSYYFHKDYVDKAGKPYYEHPQHVASLVSTPEEKIVAYLHDILEDTNCPPEEIDYLFGPEILDCVRLLTRPAGMSYMDYVRRLKKNPIARAVKIADLTHNMDITRITNPREEDYKRVEKYKKAMKLLTEE